MKIEREVTVTLTADEAAEIIKNYLNVKHPDISIDKIYFNLKTEYSGYDDRDRGTEVMHEVECTGKLKSS